MIFLDTNVFLYAGSSHPQDKKKKDISIELIKPLDFCISAQVIQEFIVNALNKKALGFTEKNILHSLKYFSHVPIQAITYEVILSACELRSRYKISHWDATILAAAKELGCTTIYTEDLNHGQHYANMQVLNPFIEL